MTYKQIEASREIRLWISQIVVPACVAGVAIAVNPTARQAVGNGVYNAKNFVTSKFKRKES